MSGYTRDFLAGQCSGTIMGIEYLVVKKKLNRVEADKLIKEILYVYQLDDSLYTNKIMPQSKICPNCGHAMYLQPPVYTIDNCWWWCPKCYEHFHTEELKPKKKKMLSECKNVSTDDCIICRKKCDGPM